MDGSRNRPRRRVVTAVVLVVLFALTGCWSVHSYVCTRCKCYPQVVPPPPVVPE